MQKKLFWMKLLTVDKMSIPPFFLVQRLGVSERKSDTMKLLKASGFLDLFRLTFLYLAIVLVNALLMVILSATAAVWSSLSSQSRRKENFNFSIARTFSREMTNALVTLKSGVR